MRQRFDRYTAADALTQRRLSPGYIVEPVRVLFGGAIGLDPCTEPDNPTSALQFYTPPADGLTLPWDAPTVYVNPPYGRARNRWVERCLVEAPQRVIVLLVPAHTETASTQTILRACASIIFIESRLNFGVLRPNRREEEASHGSLLAGFGIDLSPLIGLGVRGVAMRRCDYGR